MMELIDKEKMLMELEWGIRAGNYEEGFENYTHINSIDDCFDTVKYADTVQAIPLDKVKQAREEIYNAHMEMLREHGWSNLLIALEILDKLIESEG